MLIKLPNNKLNNKITFRRSKESYKHEFSSIINQFSNSFISIPTLWVVTALFGCLFLLNSNNVSAANTYVNLTVTSTSASMDLLPTATTSAVGKATITASITTDYSAGYTFTIAGKDNNQRLSLNGNTSNLTYLSSITSAIAATTFENASNTTYDNKWGFLPSKYCTGSTADSCSTNTNYRPGPKSGNNDSNPATTIDVTDKSNTTANSYSLAVGARANTNTTKGTYSATFTLAASGNVSGYDITYVDLHNNVPNPTTGDTNPANVTLSTVRPISTRPGYIFKGWCSVATTDNTCSGTTYQPGASYPLSEGRVTNLYAIWGEINCSTDTKYMQEVTSWQTCLKSVGDATTAIDNRDGTVYHVGRQADGKIWMTQNLDLALTTDRTLTNKDTDLNSKTEWTPPETAITANVTVDHTNKTATGWSNNGNAPYSAEGGDTYYYNSGSTSDDAKYTSLSACTGASHTEAECKHYHAGNYYNWTAAIASDSSPSSTNFYIAPDSICPRGWRLPVGKTEFTQDGSGDFANLLYNSGIITSIAASGDGSFTADGFNNIRTAPLYFARASGIYNAALIGPGIGGLYWSSSVGGSNYAYYLEFYSSNVRPASSFYRSYGYCVRCLAR